MDDLIIVGTGFQVVLFPTLTINNFINYKLLQLNGFAVSYHQLVLTPLTYYKAI